MGDDDAGDSGNGVEVMVDVDRVSGWCLVSSVLGRRGGGGRERGREGGQPSLKESH